MQLHAIDLARQCTESGVDGETISALDLHSGKLIKQGQWILIAVDARFSQVDR